MGYLFLCNLWGLCGPGLLKVQHGNNAPKWGGTRTGSTRGAVDKGGQAEDRFTAAHTTTALGRIRNVFTVLTVDRHLGGNADKVWLRAKHLHVAHRNPPNSRRRAADRCPPGVTLILNKLCS